MYTDWETSITIRRNTRDNHRYSRRLSIEKDMVGNELYTFHQPIINAIKNFGRVYDMKGANDFKINEYNIKSYLMLHGEEKPALGYIIDNKLGVTGDSGLCEGIETIFKNSTVIIADSSSKTGDMCHMGINDLIYLSNKYNKKIFCTHLLDTTRRELIENVHQNIIVKDDFYVSEI